MSMYKLDFKLKQHTPLIHFQHPQEFATLRSTEVKPKLDKFILKKLGYNSSRNGKEIAKEKGWLIGKGEHPALDYKLKIFTNETPTEYLIVSYLNERKKIELKRSGINTISPSPYFAQEELTKTIIDRENNVHQDAWDSIDKKGIIHEEIQLIVFCYHQGLLVKISELIHEFFVCENFGTRQSKGFGSFEVVFPQSIVNYEEHLKNNFMFVYRKTLREGGLENIFEVVQHDYKLLKSGRNKDNGHRPYAKSKLFLYGLQMTPPIRWEKRFLKQNLHDVFFLNKNEKYLLKTENRHSSNYGAGNDQQSWVDPIDEKYNYKYLRAVLGLSEQYEFLVEDYILNNYLKRNQKFKVKITTKKKIDRFKSPLMIKIINNKIYIVGNEIPDEIIEEMKGIQFGFTVALPCEVFKDDSEEEDSAKKLKDTLAFPDNFSLSKFMKFAMKDCTNGASLGYTPLKENNL